MSIYQPHVLCRHDWPIVRSPYTGPVPGVVSTGSFLETSHNLTQYRSPSHHFYRTQHNTLSSLFDVQQHLQHSTKTQYHGTQHSDNLTVCSILHLLYLFPQIMLMKVPPVWKVFPGVSQLDRFRYAEVPWQKGFGVTVHSSWRLRSRVSSIVGEHRLVQCLYKFSSVIIP